MFQQISQCLQPPHQNAGGLSLVHVPSGHPLPFPDGPDPKTWLGPWTTISNPSHIAQHICSANKHQYNTAATTPFATDPLLSYIGQDAGSEGSMNTLNGVDPPDSILSMLQPETISLLKTIAEPHPTPKINPSIEITPEAYRSCYTVIPERTSSSPSGHHVGHYKAALTNASLTSLHCQMMSLPFQAGLSPPRWQKVINVMLEKQPGSPRIHRLRIIALLENDFNQAIRIIFARQLGFHMEDHGMIPSKLYGSREGRQCVSAILNK
jgi:hypothetical protein